MSVALVKAAFLGSAAAVGGPGRIAFSTLLIAYSALVCAAALFTQSCVSSGDHPLAYLMCFAIGIWVSFTYFLLPGVPLCFLCALVLCRIPGRRRWFSVAGMLFIAMISLFVYAERLPGREMNPLVVAESGVLCLLVGCVITVIFWRLAARADNRPSTAH